MSSLHTVSLPIISDMIGLSSMFMSNFIQSPIHPFLLISLTRINEDIPPVDFSHHRAVTVSDVLSPINLPLKISHSKVDSSPPSVTSYT